MTEKEQDNSSPPYKIIGILTSLGIVIVWGISWCVIKWIFVTPQDASNFGQALGAISALFSGLALAGVVFAILLQRDDLRLQREELKLQREELKLTRAELKRSAAAQEASEKALKEQAAALERTAELAALSSVPAVTCDISVFREHFTLRLYNYSEIMAQSLDVKIIARYNSLVDPASEFFQRQVKGWPEDFGHLKIGDEVYYGTSDDIKVQLLPGRKQASALLAVFGEPLELLVLLQFNDLRGANFYRLYDFSFGYSEANVSVDLIEVQPPSLKAAPRAVLGYVSKDRLNPPKRTLFRKRKCLSCQKSFPILWITGKTQSQTGV